MATGAEGSGNWWGGWVQAAKEKSAEAIQQMQKDLSEFTTTIQRDTSSAVASSATIIKDSLKVEEEPSESPSSCQSTTSKVKEGFSNLLSGISDSLAPRDYGREDSPPPPRRNKQEHMFDRKKARLHAIQTDPGTYCNEPDGPLDIYEKWQETFDLEAKKGEISDLLVANTDVRALFTKLVPAAVSHSEFWSRYFYKLHQLDKDEARRAALKERADMTSSQTFTEEDLGWGDDEDESWDTMPDARQATQSPKSHSRQEDQENPQKDDQTQPTDDSSKSLANDRISEAPSRTTPDEQNISREKGATDSSQLETKHDDLPGENANVGMSSQNTCDVTDNTVASEKREGAASHEATLDTNNLPEDSPDISQSDLPLDSAETKTAPSKETVKEPGLARDNLGELKVSTKDSGKDVVDKPSPVNSETSSGNKESSSLSDDWERDFDDIEVTEEDMKAAAAVVASKSGIPDASDDLDDDWENWD